MKKIPGKDFIDAYLANRKSERESWWWIKLFLFAASGFLSFKIAKLEAISGILQLILGCYSIIVIIGVLFLLSTKFIFKGPFGGMRSGSWWDGF